jgi:1-phosphatidylinositol-3-phosphate 5-kinase
MDYSLLLGLCEDTATLVVGIVDVLGHYGLAKLVEHRAKATLRAGKETTVLPPDQYAERFRTAISRYLVACPEKWSSGPLDGRRLALPCPL